MERSGEGGEEAARNLVSVFTVARARRSPRCRRKKESRGKTTAKELNLSRWQSSSPPWTFFHFSPPPCPSSRPLLFPPRLRATSLSRRIMRAYRRHVHARSSRSFVIRRVTPRVSPSNHGSLTRLRGEFHGYSARRMTTGFRRESLLE